MKKRISKLDRNLIVISVAAVTAVLIFFGASPKRSVITPANDPKPSASSEIPIVVVRQDSLLQLIRYFTEAHNSAFAVDSSAPPVFKFHLTRFGSSIAILFCNNNTINSEESKGFTLKVYQNTGEADITLRREKVKGVFYVELPTDILCGLMNYHPKIK